MWGCSSYSWLGGLGSYRELQVTGGEGVVLQGTEYEVGVLKEGVTSYRRRSSGIIGYRRRGLSISYRQELQATGGDGVVLQATADKVVVKALSTSPRPASTSATHIPRPRTTW